MVGDREFGAVEAALAMHVPGELRFGDQRPFGAGVHGGVELHRVAHHAGVVRGALERGVPRHRRDAQQVGRVGGEHDRDRIVVAWIAVEHDAATAGGNVRHAGQHRASRATMER